MGREWQHVLSEKSQKEQSATKQFSKAGAVALAFVLRAGQVTRFLPRVRAFYKLRGLYQRVLPENFLVRTRFDGDLLLDLHLTDNLGVFLWHYPRFYEPEEIEAFCSFIRPDSTVLDIGANAGLYTLLAAKRGARVFAIEPDPLNLTMLRQNISLNGLESRVTIFEMAATETARQVSLYRNLSNMGESNILARGLPSGTVEGRTIDSLNLPPIDVCKIDVEGAELAALNGMQRTLQRSPAIKLFVEYAEAFGNSAALLDYLRANFSQLKVMEDPAANAREAVPPFCNILVTR